MSLATSDFDHPIFVESIRRIRLLLGESALVGVERELLERLVHSSGDPAIAPLLRFSPGACAMGLQALASGAVILTDTAMAASAVAPMARRTFANPVHAVLDWAPALVIGMPVGFVGVAESKRHLAASDLPQIRLEGSRGGAGLVAAAANSLLRHAWLDRQGDLSLA